MLQPTNKPNTSPQIPAQVQQTTSPAAEQASPVGATQGSPTPSSNAPVGLQDEDMSDPKAIVKELSDHLDSLSDQDKNFLAEHLTPEFVRAIGLINGPIVAQYLNQFADPNKVMVPVPRQVAEQYMAQQQAQQKSAPAQGSPQMQPQAAPPAAPQGQAPAQAPQPAPAPPPGGGMMVPPTR